MKRAKTSAQRKNATHGKKPAAPAERAGQHTLQEILSQPAAWIETTRQSEQNGWLAKLSQLFSRAEPWVFVACGSSYYLSRTVAAQWARLLGVPCSAVPASELLFAPEETLRQTGARQAVLVSRSGKTTEVLRAAELLKSKESMCTLGVTCSESSELENLCALTWKLPWTDEKSMVMTRSFTSVLLLFERIAARFAADRALASALDALPQKTERWLRGNADKIRAFAAKRRFADYVFLGQGVHYWLAQEAALKLTEMSSSYAQAYHTLEFRHGPKSIASADTLITFLLSEDAGQEESMLVGEVKKLGAATMVVTNRATTQLRGESDLLIELQMDEPDFARMALTAIPAQLLGLEVGLRKGLNPDTPKNLTRAVVLDAGDGKPEKRRSA